DRLNSGDKSLDLSAFNLSRLFFRLLSLGLHSLSTASLNASLSYKYRPAGVNMVRSMWLFKHKFHATGTLSRYKARLVANDSSQQLGVDFDETFSPVVKPATICPVLSLVVSPLLKQLIDSLHREFDMTDLRAPVDSESKMGPDGVLVQDPTMYRSLAGGFSSRLHAFTYMHPSVPLWLVILMLIGRVVHLHVETAWLRNLFREIHSPLPTATLVYCDNVSAVYMSVNPVQHQRTKHIEIDIHFVRDMVIASQVIVLHVNSCYQYAISSPKNFHQLCLKNFDPV
nr:ribonuclease H-like domain-containing protein [Tanacetum cinerariifolium]